MSTRIKFTDDLNPAFIEGLNLPPDPKSMALWLASTYGPGKEVDEMEIFSELNKHQTDNTVITDPQQYIPVLYAFYKSRFFVSKGLLESLGPPKKIKVGKLSEQQAYVKQLEDMVVAAGGTLPVKPVITRKRKEKAPVDAPVAAAA